MAPDTRRRSKRESQLNFAQAEDLEEDEEAIRRWKSTEATWTLPTRTPADRATTHRDACLWLSLLEDTRKRGWEWGKLSSPQVRVSLLKELVAERLASDTETSDYFDGSVPFILAKEEMPLVSYGRTHAAIAHVESDACGSAWVLAGYASIIGEAILVEEITCVEGMETDEQRTIWFIGEGDITNASLLSYLTTSIKKAPKITIVGSIVAKGRQTSRSSQGVP